METILISLGALALVPAVLGLALCMAMWNAWWLHPLWSVVVVPLGVPQITYWHFVALVAFVASIHRHSSPTDYAKESDKTKRSSAAVVSISLSFVSPVLVYYFVRWAM